MLTGRYLALGKMRRKSVAALLPSKNMMTQTSIEENKNMLQDLIESCGGKEENDEKGEEPKAQLRHLRTQYRRLTSIF